MTAFLLHVCSGHNAPHASWINKTKVFGGWFISNQNYSDHKTESSSISSGDKELPVTEKEFFLLQELKWCHLILLQMSVGQYGQLLEQRCAPCEAEVDKMPEPPWLKQLLEVCLIQIVAIFAFAWPGSTWPSGSSIIHSLITSLVCRWSLSPQPKVTMTSNTKLTGFFWVSYFRPTVNGGLICQWFNKNKHTYFPFSLFVQLTFSSKTLQLVWMFKCRKRESKASIHYSIFHDHFPCTQGGGGAGAYPSCQGKAALHPGQVASLS